MNNITWSPKEEKFLADNYANFSNEVLSHLIFERFSVERSARSIERKKDELNKLGTYGRILKYPKWTQRHSEYLKEHYEELTDAEIAKIFLMPTTRITRKRKDLSLTRKQKKAPREVILEKSRERSRQRYKEVTEYSRKLKGERGCSRCGESNPIVLQWHHLLPQHKTINPSNAHTIPQFEEEIKLCTVLCANCHILLHHEVL